MSKLEENISGFLIFAFVFEIRPILFPHTLLWGVQATPNQHLLTLPSSKSPGLHTEVQQFNPTQDTSFFFYTHNTRYFGHAHAYTYTRTLVCVFMCMCVRTCLWYPMLVYTHYYIRVQLLAPLFRTIFFYLVWP